MKENKAKSIYDSLIGTYIPSAAAPGIDNAFAPGQPCMVLYEQAYDAYQRLCDRLGVVDEDDDVETIDINRLAGY